MGWISKRVTFSGIAGLLLLSACAGVGTAEHRPSRQPNGPMALAISGEIRWAAMRGLYDALEDPDTRTVRITLNSVGGDLGLAVTLADQMRASGKRITAIVPAGGVCMSACTILFAAAAERIAAPDAVFMFHAPRLRISLPGFIGRPIEGLTRLMMRGHYAAVSPALVDLLDRPDIDALNHAEGLRVPARQLFQEAPGYITGIGNVPAST
jgi:hypothetical protein